MPGWRVRQCAHRRATAVLCHGRRRGPAGWWHIPLERQRYQLGCTDDCAEWPRECLPHVALQLFGSDGVRLVNNTVVCVACSHEDRDSDDESRYNYKRSVLGKSESAAASLPVVIDSRTVTQASPVSGHLDSVDLVPSGGTLSGWVVDRALSSPGPVSSNITLTVDGVFVLQMLARLPRPDLVPRIAPQPQHGFHIDLPPAVAKNLLSWKYGGNHSIIISAVRPPNGSQQVISTACVGVYRPTCGLPPDWRGAHPSSCLCETPWPLRLQVSNSIRCQFEHNVCDGAVCEEDTSGCVNE